MKKRFIVLVDFSENTESLISYAAQWSQEIFAELLFVHQTAILAPAFSDAESRVSIIEHTNNEALQKLKEVSKNIINDFSSANYYVTENNLTITLGSLLEDSNYENLILLGIKEVGLFKKLFLTSTTLQIIDKVNNCVVALPKEIYKYSHNKIYIAITEQPLNILALNNFLKFIDPNNSSLIFFYLSINNDKSTIITRQLTELVDLFSGKYNVESVIYEGEYSLESIKNVINNKVDELLVVQKNSPLLTDSFFGKIIINELVYEGATPLVVLP